MSEAGSDAAAPPAKKRRWRKPPSQVTDIVNNEENCIKTTIQSNDSMDPEMLSEEDLVSRLNEYHVPMENNCSRDELVELYSKHVMPKPQRKRNRGGQLQISKPSRVTTEHSLATASHNNIPVATCNSSDDQVVVGGANKDQAAMGGANTPGADNNRGIEGGANTEGANRERGIEGGASKDRTVMTKRKQSNDPSPPHRKKAFIRNDITWP